MERILVTGGAGYVGSACAAQLLSRGFAVDIVDDLSTGQADAVPAGADFHRFDIGDRSALSKLLSGKKFEAVFHFAAKALIPESVTNPGAFFDVNVARAIAMVETLQKHAVRKFVFSSTAAVYGSPQTIPILEDAPKNPVNSYGHSKLMFEEILKWYASAYGWSVVAFRYFNACGGAQCWGERHEPETHIIPLLLQVASGRRERFEIFGTDYLTPDGSCLRDYVHVIDIAQAHILALKQMGTSGFDAYNIGTGTSHSVEEVWKLAQEVTGKEIPARKSGRRLGDPAILCASPAKLKQKLGWAPAHSDLKEIVKGAWQWETSDENSASRIIKASVV
jgi:UDP-glucose 4-epimerase